MDFSPSKLQRDIVIGYDSREHLANVQHFNYIFHRDPPFSCSEAFFQKSEAAPAAVPAEAAVPLSYAKLPRQYKALLINLQLNIVLTQSFPHVVSGLEIFHTVYILTQFIDIEIPVMFIFFLGKRLH